MKIKSKIFAGGGGALLFAAASVFAGPYDYAFPSPLPPTGDTTDVKQIVSFIWDDNAYSGKNGSNYEGPKWMADPKFDNVGWVGGRREEAGHIFPNPNNDMTLKEGDFGMAWAAKKLSGYAQADIRQSYFLNPNFWAGYTYKLGDTLIAWSEKAKKLQVYVVAVSPYNGGFDKWPVGKTIDDLTVDPDEEVCVPKYDGATETVCKKYSQLSAYEKTAYAKSSGGKSFEVVSDNAIVKGPPTQKNPDGSNITMTFNIITGQIIPAVNKKAGNVESSADRQSKFGFWIPNDLYSKTKFGGVAISWGREYPIMLNSWDGNRDMQLKTGYWVDYSGGNGAGGAGQMQVTGYLNVAYQEAADLGHEIGNHTIDHMETNSMLPFSTSSPYPAASKAPKSFSGTAFKDGFARWGDERTSGIDEGGIDSVKMPDGEWLKQDEVEAFGQTPGSPQQYMGWKGYIGKVLSKQGWKGLIDLGAEQIFDYLDISKQGDKIVAFRAPRLEVNSNLFWALKDAGYLYDCGLEEGYEYNMNGTNYLWPYTMDNGSPNVAWQRMVGENKSNFDSLPYGLWQIPVAVLIVPQDKRQGVWDNYEKIAKAEGEKPTEEDRTSWMQNGKITGFDFNLFILHGATKDAAIATMRHSLDQRMKGGKAPMQIGSHSDYFTPIYDNATLLNAANKSTYGLVVTNKWNSWKDRIETWEDIRDYGLSKGAYFWDGKKTIEYVRTLVAAAKVGNEEKKITDIGQWTFFTHDNKSTANNQNFTADITNAEINTQASESELAGYAVYGDKGEFEFDHISLSYSTSAPLTIRLITDEAIDEAYPYEITLSNLNGWDASVANKNYFVNSGQIPLSAFQRNQYVGSDHPDLVGLQSIGTDFTKNITGIEVAVQVPENKAQKTSLSIKDFTLYSGERTEGIKVVGIANKPKTAAQKIAVQAMTSNALKLNLAKPGIYNVDIITINGRVVKSFKNQNLSSGLNTLSLGNIAKGMYLIRIHNKNFLISLKSPLL